MSRELGLIILPPINTTCRWAGHAAPAGLPLTPTMHSAFSPSHNSAYPYYGQPYHAYIPPGYPQQHPRSTFTHTAGHTTPPEPSGWPREKLAFPQPTPARQSPPSKDPPFVPQNPDTLDAGHIPKPRLKRASTTRPKQVSEKPPLKPALKKKNGIKRADSASAVPLERTRTSSSARQRLAPTTRPRSNSNPSFLPGNYFICLSSDCLTPSCRHLSRSHVSLLSRHE